ncbi:MAG: hypothetical protein ACTSRV_11515, partial [Candidatus Freyarchaeota archaeon]
GVPRILEMAEAYINELYAYFEDYLLTGGFPLAVRQHLERGRINPNVYTEYVDLAAKDALRWRLNEDTLFNVLWELLRVPGGPFEAVPIKETSTNKLAGRLGISHNTVKQYLDYLVDAFVLLEVPKLKQLDTRSPPPKSPKKYYFWDPLMFYALKAMSAGSRDPYTTALNNHETWKPVTTDPRIHPRHTPLEKKNILPQTPTRKRNRPPDRCPRKANPRSSILRRENRHQPRQKTGKNEPTAKNKRNTNPHGQRNPNSHKPRSGTSPPIHAPHVNK